MRSVALVLSLQLTGCTAISALAVGGAASMHNSNAHWLREKDAECERDPKRQCVRIREDDDYTFRPVRQAAMDGAFVGLLIDAMIIGLVIACGGRMDCNQ